MTTEQTRTRYTVREIPDTGIGINVFIELNGELVSTLEAKQELVRRANAYDELVAYVRDQAENTIIVGKNCPCCGRDNSADRNLCTSDDCFGVQARALLDSLNSLEVQR